MVNLKEFYNTIESYSKFGIKKFINFHTDNLKPFLLTELNSEFVDMYLNEIRGINNTKSKDEFNDLLENLSDENKDSSTPIGTNHLLVREYILVDEKIEVSEKEFVFENLSYRDYNRMNNKIDDFKTCMQEIFEGINKNEEAHSIIVDLSNTSATEKIIYLHKLGVLDLLKKKQPFQTSTNSLAVVLSAITGEKAGTIQSMINPILSKKVDDKNSPLNSPKPVDRVTKTLIAIGFDLDETI